MNSIELEDTFQEDVSELPSLGTIEFRPEPEYHILMNASRTKKNTLLIRLLKWLSTAFVAWLLIMGILMFIKDTTLQNSVRAKAMQRACNACDGAEKIMETETLIATDVLKRIQEAWKSGDEARVKDIMKEYIDNPDDFSSCVGILVPAQDGEDPYILELRLEDMNSSDSSTSFVRKTAAWVTVPDWNSLDQITGNGTRMGVTSPCLLPKELDDGIQLIMPLEMGVKPSEGGAIWSYGTETNLHQKLFGMNLSSTGWSFMVVPDRLQQDHFRVLGYPMNNPYSENIIPFDEYQFAMPLIHQSIKDNKPNTESFAGEDYTSRFYISSISVPNLSIAICLIQYENELVPEMNSTFAPSVLTTGYLSYAVAGIILLICMWIPGTRNLFLMSTLASIIMVVGLVYLWVIVRQDSPPISQSIIPITDVQVLDEFKANYLVRQQTLNQNATIAPCYVTIYVDAVDYNGAGCALIGRAWLKVPLSIPDPRPNNVLFPTASNEEWNLLNKKTMDDHELISFSFKAEFSQMTRSALYPFGNQVMEVPMDISPLSSNTFLLPNLNDYWSMNANLSPGLASTVVTPGEVYIESFMGMYMAAVNPDKAAVTVPLAGNDAPRCVFVFATLRDLSSIILDDLMPLLAVLAILFVLTLMSTRHDNRRGRLGYDTMQVLVVVGPLMAVLVLNTIDGSIGDQASLLQPYKQALNASVFGIMMLVVVSSYILQTSEDHMSSMSTHDKIAKMVFWPLTTSVWLLITLLMI